MIHSIIPPNNFYSLINAPNKEDLVKGLRRAKVDPVATKNISWNKDCDVKVDVLYDDEVCELFTPILEIFVKQFENHIPLNWE